MRRKTALAILVGIASLAACGDAGPGGGARGTTDGSGSTDRGSPMSPGDQRASPTSPTTPDSAPGTPR